MLLNEISDIHTHITLQQSTCQICTVLGGSSTKFWCQVAATATL